MLSYLSHIATCEVHVVTSAIAARNKPLSCRNVMGNISTSAASLESLSRSSRDVMIDVTTLAAFFGNFPLLHHDVQSPHCDIALLC